MHHEMTRCHLESIMASSASVNDTQIQASIENQCQFRGAAADIRRRWTRGSWKQGSTHFEGMVEASV